MKGPIIIHQTIGAMIALQTVPIVLMMNPMFTITWLLVMVALTGPSLTKTTVLVMLFPFAKAQLIITKPTINVILALGPVTTVLLMLPM
jgi:hypothetical protein